MEIEEELGQQENSQEVVNEFYLNEVQQPTGTSEYIDNVFGICVYWPWST